MRTVIFDTETTGISYSDVIVQIAWEVLEDDIVVDQQCHILRTTKHIGEQAMAVHGITEIQRATEGKHPYVVLSRFLDCMRKADRLVAHNMAFDERITMTTCTGYGLKDLATSCFSRIEKICTMRRCRDWCDARNKNNAKKPPSLMELYQKAFGEPFTGAHQADADVAALRKVYLKLQGECFAGIKRIVKTEIPSCSTPLPKKHFSHDMFTVLFQ